MNGEGSVDHQHLFNRSGGPYYALACAFVFKQATMKMMAISQYYIRL